MPSRLSSGARESRIVSLFVRRHALHGPITAAGLLLVQKAAEVGLYDVPRCDPLFGELQPTTDEIAQALSRRDGTLVQPAQAMAANLLKLSEQVPARAVYETDGPSRIVKVGSLTIELRHRPPRQVRSASPMSNLLFAALRSVGKTNVNEPRVAHLRKTLSANDRAALLKDLPLAPAWMHPYLRFIAAAGERLKLATKAVPLPKRTTRAR